MGKKNTKMKLNNNKALQKNARVFNELDATKIRSRFELTKLAYTLPAIASIVNSYPALALVDDRLNGDGTGKALGINDPAVGWAIFLAFAAVWSFFYISTKELGGQSEEDGLGL